MNGVSIYSGTEIKEHERNFLETGEGLNDIFDISHIFDLQFCKEVTTLAFFQMF